MGSGDRFKVYRTHCFGLGFSVARFPFALTVRANFMMWGVSLGFGKGYDQ